MDCGELVATVNPPATPVDAAGDWSRVRHSLSNLPKDYRNLVGQYGAGCFGGFIWVYNPFTANKSLNLLLQVEVIREVHRSLQIEFGEERSYAYFPEPSGLLPFGVTDNGDYLYWLTVGEPDDWKVVVGAARAPLYESFNLGACSFLAAVLTRRVRCGIFPKSFPGATPAFVPWSGT
jgi:hypothetical protein